MKHDEPAYKSMWPEAECPSCAEKDAEIKRLRDAVEWAINYINETFHDEFANYFSAELRRRVALKSAVPKEGK